MAKSAAAAKSTAPAPAPSTAQTAKAAYTKAGGSVPPTKQGGAAGVGRAGAAVDEGAGFLLALFLWGWIVLPFIHGGTGSVKDMLRAKFVNKAHDGTWLP